MRIPNILNPKAREWLLQNFALGVKNYWFTFVADSSCALFFLLWDLYANHLRPVYVLGAVFSGYLLWGLSEYIVHRWMYHHDDSIFGDGHRIHHEDAMVLIAMPWFMTTISVFSLWYLCAVALHIPNFSGCLAGWLAGFVWYSIVHHSHHHWNIQSSWMRKLKAYHRIHHQFPDRNYGVTMRFWDDVFRTRFHKAGGRNPAPSGNGSKAPLPEPAAKQFGAWEAEHLAATSTDA